VAVDIVEVSGKWAGVQIQHKHTTGRQPRPRARIPV
jgi:hypothetical protein